MAPHVPPRSLTSQSPKFEWATLGLTAEGTTAGEPTVASHSYLLRSATSRMEMNILAAFQKARAELEESKRTP